MIERVGGPPPLREARGPLRRGGDFAAPSSDAPAAVGLAEVGAVALGGMLAMQEAETDAAADRQARRDGEDMLRELAALQRDLLTDGARPSALERLAGIAARARPASDPRLRGVLAAIDLRVRVELARYAATPRQSDRR